VRVGHQSVIGAGSVVLRNVGACTTAFGVPAKSISR
jgi:serine acetyltransferase